MKRKTSNLFEAGLMLSFYSDIQIGSEIHVSQSEIRLLVAYCSVLTL